MVAQREHDDSLQERVGDYLRNREPEGSAPTEDEIANELVNALDTLLLEKAVEEHRAALSRLNKLKQGLGRNPLKPE